MHTHTLACIRQSIFPDIYACTFDALLLLNMHNSTKTRTWKYIHTWCSFTTHFKVSLHRRKQRHMYRHKDTHTHIHTHICIYTYMYIYIYIHIYIHIHTYIYIYIYTYIYIYIYTYVHINIHTRTHTHTHTHTHTFTCTYECNRLTDCMIANTLKSRENNWFHAIIIQTCDVGLHSRIHLMQCMALCLQDWLGEDACICSSRAHVISRIPKTFGRYYSIWLHRHRKVWCILETLGVS